METEHMQWGPLVEIRGSVSALIVGVVTNSSLFYYCCWKITLPNSGKHILFSSFFPPLFSIWHAWISALGWFCIVVLRYWTCHWPWKRGKLLMDRNKEPADCTQNIRSMLGKFIFDRTNLNEKVVGYVVATGLIGQDLIMKALIEEDILSYILNDKIQEVTTYSSEHYANLWCTREKWNLSYLIRSKVKIELRK